MGTIQGNRKSLKTLVLILAGGTGEELSVLTRHRAKTAVPFGGRYRVIDFCLSNCVHSGLHEIAVLAQYSPKSLIDHIGMGRPWDLDRKTGGVYILQPTHNGEAATWYLGTADALYQNIDLIKNSKADTILVLSGDQIYVMDYQPLLRCHLDEGEGRHPRDQRGSGEPAVALRHGSVLARGNRDGVPRETGRLFLSFRVARHLCVPSRFSARCARTGKDEYRVRRDHAASQGRRRGRICVRRLLGGHRIDPELLPVVASALEKPAPHHRSGLAHLHEGKRTSAGAMRRRIARERFDRGRRLFREGTRSPARFSFPE